MDSNDFVVVVINTENNTPWTDYLRKLCCITSKFCQRCWKPTSWLHYCGCICENLGYS